MTVHFLEDFRTAGLERQMQVFANLITFLHCQNQFIGHILGMRSHETNTFNAFHLIYHTQQFCEGNWIFQIFTIRVYILT